jgi:hypothetical protein
MATLPCQMARAGGPHGDILIAGDRLDVVFGRREQAVGKMPERPGHCDLIADLRHDLVVVGPPAVALGSEQVRGVGQQDDVRVGVVVRLEDRDPDMPVVHVARPVAGRGGRSRRRDLVLGVWRCVPRRGGWCATDADD